MCCYSRLRYFSVFALLEVGIRCALFCLRVVLSFLCLSVITSSILSLRVLGVWLFVCGALPRSLKKMEKCVKRRATMRYGGRAR